MAIFGTRRWGCVPGQEKHIYDELIINIMKNVRLFILYPPGQEKDIYDHRLKMILAIRRSTIGAYERWVK